MKRFALPLIILGVTLVLIFLIAFMSTGTVDYSGGKATEQPISAEWVRGASNAKVVLVEYSDFQCPACQAYERLLKPVQDLYQDRVAFVYRQFPLYQIHPNADLAARVSEAAGVQGKFWEMHDLLFAKHDEWADRPNAETFMMSYADELGLDQAAFKQALDSAEIKQAVADDYARGLAAGITGTPTFFLNGVKLSRNPQTLEEFRTLLDAQLAK